MLATIAGLIFAGTAVLLFAGKKKITYRRGIQLIICVGLAGILCFTIIILL